MKKIAISIGVVAVLIFGGWYVSSLSTPGDSGVSGAVAVVNGESVSREDFNMLQGQIAAEQGFDISTLGGEEREQIEARVLEMLVSQTLVNQAAKNSGITASDEEVDAQMELIVSQFGGQAEFEEAVGITQEEFREHVSSEISIQHYVDQELDFSSITATESEVLDIYEQSVASMGEGAPSLEDVYGEVEQMVIQQKQQELVAQLIDDLRADADIEILI